MLLQGQGLGNFLRLVGDSAAGQGGLDQHLLGHSGFLSHIFHVADGMSLHPLEELPLVSTSTYGFC